ncbi:MAG: HTTM domain-containing protein [Saprospirales bacterium]|nr:HTTM domain-containing protein [Saprospirales bacterium]
MNATYNRFKSWLGAPIDGQVIGLFRLLFGLFMAYYALYYYRIGLIPEGLQKSKILFKYEFFEWVPLLPGPLMYFILFLMGAAALLIAAGVFFRWACWLFSLCLAFFLFQEKSYYNNHIYLFILLPLLLSATDADRYLSLSRKPRPASVQRWQQFILAAQVMMVYFYAGIVKFKADWLLRKEPMSTMIRDFPDAHWMASLIKHDVNINLFTYGGFLLDILAPFLLFYKPVRNWAWIPFALFHLTNSQVFNDIGIFPFVMLGAMILFFDTNEIPVLHALSPAAAGQGKGKNARRLCPKRRQRPRP